MDMSEAAHLQKKWAGKPCGHSSTKRETFNGVKTGDRVCTTCGECFSPDEIALARGQQGK